MFENLPNISYNSILVVNALNGAFPLALREAYPNACIVCGEVFPFFHEHLRGLGFEVVEWDKVSMKFDLVIGNPPYLKGKWTNFLKQAVALSNQHVFIISPDGTNNFSNRSDALVEFLQNNGVQDIVDVTKSFPDVNSGAIVAYRLDVTIPFNPKCFEQQTPEQMIVQKVVEFDAPKLDARLSSNRGKSFTSALRYDSGATGLVHTLESVTKSGPKWSWMSQKDATVVDGDRYWFTNRYFGKDVDAPLIATTGNIGIGTNILAIAKPNDMDEQSFKRIYLHKLMRFVLHTLRKGGFDTSPRHIKQLPQLSKDSGNLYKLFSLSPDEIALVESSKL